MAYTQTDLDNIDRAIAQAELEVELEGRRVKYRSMSELLSARAHIAGLLANATPRRATYYPRFVTSRGD